MSLPIHAKRNLQLGLILGFFLLLYVLIASFVIVEQRNKRVNFALCPLCDQEAAK